LFFTISSLQSLFLSHFSRTFADQILNWLFNFSYWSRHLFQLGLWIEEG
jgi:hypothetical protein